MTITLTDEATLHPLVLPARADAADAADFRAYAAVRNRILVETTGRDDDVRSPDELLPLLRSDADAIRRQWSVRIGDATVGCVTLNVPLDAGSRAAFWLIALLPEVWGRGIGRAAAAVVESEAQAHGRSVLQTWVEHPAGGAETLPSPTGFGSVPLDHAARFLQRQGHRLEQVERVSAFEFSAAALDLVRELLADAERAAAGYRVVQWMLPTPPERVAGYAWMKSRMSTDVPTAALEFAEEHWDAERVARHDARYAEMGHPVQVTAAEHIATAELCAFNELAGAADPAAATHQEDTLVLSDHRGHRLGMLVKAAGILSWHERYPRSPRIITYNAEENRPMLSINEALGFTPIAYEGAWKKELT